MLMCLFSPAVPAERLITRPAKATGRPARQAQQHLAASQPVRGGIEPTIAAPSADHVRELEPLGPTTPDHRPTNPAIAGPVVQHPSVATSAFRPEAGAVGASVAWNAVPEQLCFVCAYHYYMIRSS